MIRRSRVACCSVFWLLTIIVSAFADEPTEYEITDADREHWSFRPVARPAVPAVKNREWGRTPIDAFVLAKLEAAAWSPNLSADRRDMLRARDAESDGNGNQDVLPHPIQVAA